MKDVSNKTLVDVCEFVVDCLHATAPDQGNGFPLIRTPNVGRGRLLLDDVHRVSDEVYRERIRRAVPQVNDLILAREAPAGNVAIIKDGEAVCLGQRTVHLRPDPEQVDPDFLCYYLLAPKQQGNLLAGETGATAKHVNMSDIRRLSLKDLPSVEIQRAIGSTLAAYDDLIENNRRRIQLLEEAARQLYREWFVRLRFPGHEHVKIRDGVPEGWVRAPLGKVATLKYGKALHSDNRIEGDYPVYGSSGVIGTHDKAWVKGPAIVVGRKGTVGSVFWSEEDFNPIDTVYFITQEQSSLCLYYALQNMTFMSTDVAVPGLNRDFAHSKPLLAPDAKLRNLFHESVVPLHRQMQCLKKQNDSLATARDILMPRLMNGDIPV